MSKKTYSNSLTLVRVADGYSADSYFIQTNYMEVLKIETSRGAQFLPEDFNFRVLNLSRPEDQQTITNFDWQLSFLTTHGFEQVIDHSGLETGPLSGIFIEKKDLSSTNEGSYDTLHWDTGLFYKKLKEKIANADADDQASIYLSMLEMIDQGRAVFRFAYMINEYTVSTKLITIANGISADMAKFNIGVSDITASILNSSLKFSPSGLSLFNGDFKISKPTYYELGTLTEDQFSEAIKDNTLYIQTVNKDYVKALNYDSEAKFFYATEEDLFYTDPLGNLTLKGQVYADGGYFRGDIYADNGLFNGTIITRDGQIGDFYIGETYLPISIEDDTNNSQIFVLLDNPTQHYEKVEQISIKQASSEGVQFFMEDGSQLDVEVLKKAVFAQYEAYYKKVSISAFEEGHSYYKYVAPNYQAVEAGEYFDSEETYYQILDCFDGYYEKLGNDYNKVDMPVSNKSYYCILKEDWTEFYLKTGNGIFAKNGNLKLNASGLVEAENIVLGSQAKVRDQIIFSTKDNQVQAALYNPDKHNDKFLRAANVELTSYGKLTIGSIEMYGGGEGSQAYIRSYYIDSNNEVNDGYWRINGDGSAQFDTVSINNALIKNSILEKQTVQSVGSLMVFKDAWEIEYIETQEYSDLFVQKEASIFQGQWVWNGQHYYYISEAKDKIYYILENGVYSQASVDKFLPGTNYYELVDPEGDTPTYKQTEDKYPLKVLGIVDSYDSDWNAGLRTLINMGYDSGETYIKNFDVDPLIGRVYYTLEENGEYKKCENLIQFNADKEYYYIGADADGDYIISILGEQRNHNDEISDTNSYKPEQDDLLQRSNIGNFSVPNSLAISSFHMDKDSNKPVYTKRLVLGELSNAGIDTLSSLSGVGLYADNVYLHGSLVTKNQYGNYAGIQTNSAISFVKGGDFDLSDTSPIIFWGGAASLESEAIKQAPFQITQNGTLYAQNALIENATYVGGELRVPTIYCARLYGDNSNSQGSQAALNIYDGFNGIAFWASSNKKLFTISADSFVAFDGTEDGQSFIEINDSDDASKKDVCFYGKFQSKESGQNTEKTVYLDHDGLSFSQKINLGEDNKQDQGGKMYCGIKENKPYFSFDFGAETALIGIDAIELNSKTVIKNEMWIGEKVQFKKNSNSGFEIHIHA